MREKIFEDNEIHITRQEFNEKLLEFKADYGVRDDSDATTRCYAFIGTASSNPSKYRNVSAILLHGIFCLLKARHRAFAESGQSPSPCAFIGPRGFNRWLEFFSQHSGEDGMSDVAEAKDLQLFWLETFWGVTLHAEVAAQTRARFEKFVKNVLGLNKLAAIRVEHSTKVAAGFAIRGGGKVRPQKTGKSFTAGTPCPALIWLRAAWTATCFTRGYLPGRAGVGGPSQEAQHSWSGPEPGGRAMRAGLTILTHFSTRYTCSVPVLKLIDGKATSGCGFRLRSHLGRRSYRIHERLGGGDQLLTDGGDGGEAAGSSGACSGRTAPVQYQRLRIKSGPAAVPPAHSKLTTMSVGHLRLGDHIASIQHVAPPSLSKPSVSATGPGATATTRTGRSRQDHSTPRCRVRASIAALAAPACAAEGGPVRAREVQRRRDVHDLTPPWSRHPGVEGGSDGVEGADQVDLDHSSEPVGCQVGGGAHKVSGGACGCAQLHAEEISGNYKTMRELIDFKALRGCSKVLSVFRLTMKTFEPDLKVEIGAGY
uniref:Reverse transcriptase domain-containing protein n=1 Tax=Macrostomum lignano TaxID=282301 RepID=A0A1I8FBX5_9PLAT